ncbi:MAG: hypothetical protein L6R39_000703 [Caloplaca ligustica]|nr:MAG: hypothetical protein L6R39_000703 [Caloplaca ligustica]
MSGELLGHPDEDQYFYNSQYGSDRDGMAPNRLLMSYQSSQAQSDFQNTTHHIQPVNTNAFNTNAQFLVPAPHSAPHSFHQQVPTVAHDSFSTPLALPGLLNAMSAQRSDAEPRATPENLIATVPPNGVDEGIGRVGSELEEGELSEGSQRNSPLTHAPSRPPSAQQPSLKANDTIHRETPRNCLSDTTSSMAPYSDGSWHTATKGNRSIALGAESMRNGQPHQPGSHIVHPTANGHAKSDYARPTHTQLKQSRQKKSFKVIKGGARRAVKQLQSHHIGYLQLLEEHIDSDLLKKLFTELNMKIPEKTEIGAFPTNVVSESHSTEQGLTFDPKQTLSARNTNEPAFLANDVEIGQDSPLRASLPRDQQGVDAIKAVGTLSSKVPHEIREGRSDHGNGLNTGLGTLPQLTKAKNILEYAGKHSHDETATNPSAVNGNKPPFTQATPQAPPQPSAPTATSKPPAPKAAAKPIDRKDYVARLLAAKAGKALPAARASKPPPDLAPQNVGQKISAGVNDQAYKTDQAASLQTSKDHASNEASASYKLATDGAPPKPATDEAKKRAQTELARRKIEELKKRSEALKKAPSSANEEPASSATPQPSSIERPIQAHSVGVAPASTGSPLPQNTPQHTLFPRQSTTFALPGLFMSSQQSQPDRVSGPVRVRPSSDRSQRISESQSVAVNVADNDDVAHQAIPIGETSVPSTQENKVPVEGPKAEAEIPRVVSNPRKRPTAADFIESVPAKPKRVHTSKEADNSVVFDISDDEVDESIHDPSEMQLNGDQNAKPSYVLELSDSRTGTTEQANFRQHPALSDPHGKLDQVKSTPTMLLQGSLTPFKQNESAGLRAREEEIARMHRRIAEIEERRKAKQAASPAPMPETPGQTTPSVKPDESHITTSSMPGVARRFSEPAKHIKEGEHIPEELQMSDPSLQKDVAAQQQPAQDIGRLEAAQSRTSTVRSGEHQHRQRRKAEIESRIPSMSAALEGYMSRLQNLQKEEAELQARMQKEIDDKRALEEELDRIMQAATSLAEDSGQESNVARRLQATGEVQGAGLQADGETKNNLSGYPLLDPSLSQQAPQHPELAPVDSGAKEIHEALQSEGLTLQSELAHEPLTPETAPSSAALTNQSFVSGELAEGVMDISGSEDGDSVTGDTPTSNTNVAPPTTESDREDLYEPPPSFGPINSTTPADPETQYLDRKETPQRVTLQQKPPTPLGERSRTIDVQEMIEDAGTIALPSPSEHAPSDMDMDDSDDYEPPEHMTSVDADPLTNNAAITPSQSPFSPPDANQVAEVETTSADRLSVEKEQVVNDLAKAESYDPEKASPALHDTFQVLPQMQNHEHFSPYESPLKRFHAYRYHPDFVSRVGGGYRSLTYSHKIDATKPICPYEVGGRCNDASCENQHFKSMNLSGAFGEQAA